MYIIKRIKHDIKMRRLNRNIDYALSKMKQHESDVDSREWKSWAHLNLMYLMLLTDEMNTFSQQIRRH